MQHHGRIEHQLEPTDRGPAAWRLLCIAFVFEALLWGESVTWHMGVCLCFAKTLHRLTCVIRAASVIWCLPKLLLETT